MEIFFIILFGLCIGSFLNVCIFRIAKEENIAFPPSHCTSCSYELKVKDLIPVFSYIFLKGKCRNCKENISNQYPIVEILNSTIYVLLYLQFGLSISLIKYCLLVSLLIVIGFIDFETKYVYSSTVIFGIVSAVIFFIVDWIITKRIPVSLIIGGILGFGVIWLIVHLTGGMGEGDVDIALIIGLFLGTNNILLALFLSFVIGGIAATFILVFKLNKGEREIAFGPYLAIGGILTMLYGTNLINYYLNLL